MAEIPSAFCERMKHLLGDEYQAFYASYQQPRIQGLRLNTRKVIPEKFLKQAPFELEKIPWAQQGYYYSEQQRPGKHPYHEAGLYYIQEPSAMAVVELLDPQPGEMILDLCAAPGGKTTQIADKLQGKGFLLANEFHSGRAKILSQNVERMGICNAVVTNESPQRLAERFPAYFDRVLVDAPCSGEGMFRKNPIAAEEWSQSNVEICAARQLEILRAAASMLRPEGRLVYSTCTFSPEENESVLEQFCQEQPHFRIQKLHRNALFSQGRPEWVDGREELRETVRLWPHRLRGGGHFIAVLRKEEGETGNVQLYRPKPIERDRLQQYQAFEKAYLRTSLDGERSLFGESLYIVPPEMADMTRLKVVRPGMQLGTVKKNRFEPSHALALASNPQDFARSVHFTANSPEIAAYLRGETIMAEGVKGWCLIVVDGYSLGLGKQSGDMIKNHYPKGLRWK